MIALGIRVTIYINANMTPIRVSMFIIWKCVKFNG